MSPDELNKILAYFKKLEDMIENVQETQKCHTGKFEDIKISNQCISRMVCGPIVKSLSRIEKSLDIKPLTDFSDELNKVKKAVLT